MAGLRPKSGHRKNTYYIGL